MRGAMRTWFVFVAACSIASMAACGPATPATLPPAHASRTASALPDTLAALNAELRRGAVTERVAGIEVSDPYRALEADTPDTQRWIDAQSAHTERVLQASHNRAMEQRLRELLSIGSIDDVALGGSRVFFTMREGDRERPALFVRDLAPGSNTPIAEPLLAPERFGPRASIDYAVPSTDGRYVAFGVSDNGDERSTLRVFDVDARRELGDVITQAKWSSVAWLHDHSGFLYTRYPRPGEPNYDATHEDTYFSRVFLHRLGESSDRDALVFSGSAPEDFPAASVDASGRYVVVMNFRSWTASDVWLWDRSASPTTVTLQPVVTGRDAMSTGSVHDGALYLMTTLDAPRKRVMRVDLSAPSDASRWRDVLPEGPSSLDDLAITHGTLATHVIDDIRSTLSIYTTEGQARGEVALPTRGSVESLDADVQGDRLAFVFSSYLYPPALFVYDLRTQALQRVHQVRHDLDTSRFALSRARVRSLDGTQVNVDYIHPTTLQKTGDNPVLLTGYGGFDVSLLPELRRSALYFVERGGIFAQANLRGGGEYGEAFHRAGMLQNKHRVFEDFEAVIQWLADSGLSRPGRIAITGGSNGGLLMGAMLTRVPERFAAAISYVGLYDMLRYPQFPPAAIWVSEYGDPTDPAMARYLLGYSPYHQIRTDTAYPASLIETADHDTRVSFAHSTKFAARLQEASAGPAPVLFYMERAVGHGSGTGLGDLVRRESRKYAFVAQALGLP
jgi:prolyl oligopeptidase